MNSGIYYNHTGIGPVTCAGVTVVCCGASFGTYDEDDEVRCMYCGRYMGTK